MGFTKHMTETEIIYSFGDEKAFVVSIEKSEKLVFKINGAIKTIVAPCFDEVIKDAMARKEDFILDFSGVTYIASAGLRVLLNMQQEIDENEEPDVAIVNVPESVKEVFEQTGFNNILNIRD